MSRFQGSNSISSDDYFGRASNTPKSSVASTLSSANFYDIKEGVRDGVTKVAGKLSTLATDVMSSIQSSQSIQTKKINAKFNLLLLWKKNKKFDWIPQFSLNHNSHN